MILLRFTSRTVVLAFQRVKFLTYFKNFIESTIHLPKTNYNVNDTLDVTNGEILVTRQTGEPEVKEITKDMVTGFDSSKENTKLPLKVTYTETG